MTRPTLAPPMVKPMDCIRKQVRQLCEDLGDAEKVNAALEQAGEGMGRRAADEFCAQTGWGACGRFPDCLRGAAAGLRLFLGIDAEAAVVESGGGGGGVNGVAAALPEGTLRWRGDPLSALADAADYPPGFESLRFASALSGAVRGALAAVGAEVSVVWEADTATGDAESRLRVKLLRQQGEQAPIGDD